MRRQDILPSLFCPLRVSREFPNASHCPSPERGIEVLSHAIHEATIVAAKEEWRGDEHATQHRQNPNDSSVACLGRPTCWRRYTSSRRDAGFEIPKTR